MANIKGIMTETTVYNVDIHPEDMEIIKQYAKAHNCTIDTALTECYKLGLIDVYDWELLGEDFVKLSFTDN